MAASLGTVPRRAGLLQPWRGLGYEVCAGQSFGEMVWSYGPKFWSFEPNAATFGTYFVVAACLL